MKTLLPILLLASAAFGASAQTAVSAGVQLDAGASQSSQSRDDGRIDPFCLQHTGSRIVAHANARAAKSATGEPPRMRCANAHGRVYSREDIDRTGAGYDLAEALRRLDTSIY